MDIHNCRGTELGNQGDVDRIVGFGWLLQKEISQDEARKALGHIKGWILSYRQRGDDPELSISISNERTTPTSD